MESFVYRELNKACYMKDLSKVPTLGPFAVLISQIVYSCDQNKKLRKSIGSNSSSSDSMNVSVEFKTIYRGL